MVIFTIIFSRIVGRREGGREGTYCGHILEGHALFGVGVPGALHQVQDGGGLRGNLREGGREGGKEGRVKRRPW